MGHQQAKLFYSPDLSLPSPPSTPFLPSIYPPPKNVPGEAIFLAVSASSLLYLSRDMRGTWKASTVAQAATKEVTVTKRRAILGLKER